MLSPITAALTPGLKGEVSAVVTDAMTGPVVGSGLVVVLATPAMVALMEGAAVACVDHLLPPGHNTVGTHLVVSHAAPTPPGVGVTARAELTVVDGRKLTFEIEARDAVEIIGRATHTRIVVDRARFDAKVAAKLEAAKSLKNKPT
jgi:fluoroacetyl-CoA thioesterase